MYHNVYAQLELSTGSFEEDGGTWLATDLEHDIIADLEPVDLEVVPMEIGPSSNSRPWTGVEINFTSSLDARSIDARLQAILDKHDPLDTLVGID
jgi:hypothetical protein